MKNMLFIFIMMFIIGLGSLYSQIEVPKERMGLPVISSPSAGVTWEAGKSYPIVWQAKEFEHPTQKQVKINLFHKVEQRIIHRVVNPTDNTGSYSWSIPKSILTGEYRIKIKLIKVNKAVLSSVFTIIGKTPRFAKKKPPINIKRPTSSSNWMEGEKEAIKWETTDKDRYMLELWRSKKSVKVMDIMVPAVDTTPDKFLGKYEAVWPIPSLPGSAKYRIRVVAKNGNNAFSPKFIISSPLKKQIIKISPNQIDNKEKGDYAASKGATTSKFDVSKCPSLVVNPGRKIMRVGFVNCFQRAAQDTEIWVYRGRIYRSFAYFDLDELRTKLKGKGVIAKVELKLDVYEGGATCPMHTRYLDYPVLDEQAFGDIGTPFTQKSRVKVVQDWVNHDETYTPCLFFIGSDETFTHDNRKCVAISRNIYLEVEVWTTD